MKSKKQFLLIAGAVLILLSVGFFIIQNFYAGRTSQNATIIATEIGKMIPNRSTGVEESYTNTQMPALQFEGNDYVCLLEVPSDSVCLPVQNDWNTKALMYAPCRFWGSSYDGSLILGGSGSKGQFDFCGLLEIGDQVMITDMEGTLFTYTVEHIDRSKTAQFEKLSDPSYSLTLFVQEAYSTSYIVVRCNMAM